MFGCAILLVNRWSRTVELMTEKQILGFEPASRLEHVGYKHSERVQDCKHRSQ
jgi:hypothetical protein